MFKRLLYVYTVYKEQSFSRAAEKLYISQPSLSAAVKKTEEEVGFPLFERGFSPIRLTQIGEKYMEAAEEILSIQKNFTSFLEDTQSLKQGSLSVGGSHYVSSYILPQLVGHFADRYPGISITLQEAASVELEALVKKEALDLVIDSFGKDHAIYETYPLTTEKIMLAVPATATINSTLSDFQILPEHIRNNSLDYRAVPALSAEFFKDQKYILLKNGNDMYFQAKHIFKEAHISPEVIFSLDQLITSYNLCASGTGVCFVTDTLFRYNSYPNNVFLYNILESEDRTLHIAHKKGRYCTRAMEEFIRLAKEMITYRL